MTKERAPPGDAPRRIVKDPPLRKPAGRPSKTDAERLDDVLKKRGPGELDAPDRRKPRKDR